MRNNILKKGLSSIIIYIFFIAGFFQAMAEDVNNDSKSKRVDKLFESTLNVAIAGASVIIIQNGEILLKKGYGLADIEREIPNTSATIFRLGSVTKQFTAMAIMQLYDKQLLQLNDPVENYLPGIINGDIITIKHLLTHTSGLAESLDSVQNNSPGELLNYSNTGYNVLGEVIEKITGSSYETYLQENIFEPLGMNNTGYEHQDLKSAKWATGYKWDDGGHYQNVGDSDVSGAYAAGALYSTVEDMYLWDQALSSEMLVKSGTLEKVFSPVELNDGSKAHYGFGWMINQWHGIKEVSHGGDINGFNSYIARFPDEQFTVIVLSNIEMRPPGPLANAGDLVHKVAEIYLSEKMADAKVPLVRLDPKILEKYTGQYKLINAPQPVVEAGGEIYTIVMRNNQLFVLSKMGEQEIFAQTDIKFYLENNTTIEFKKESDQVKGMVIDLMGLGVRIVKADKMTN